MNLVIKVANPIFSLFLEYIVIPKTISKSITIRINFVEDDIKEKLKNRGFNIQNFGKEISYYIKLLQCLRLIIPLNIQCKAEPTIRKVNISQEILPQEINILLNKENNKYHKPPITGNRIGTINNKLCDLLKVKSLQSPTLRRVLNKCPLLSLGLFKSSDNIKKFFTNVIRNINHQESYIEHIIDVQDFFMISDADIENIKKELRSGHIDISPDNILHYYVKQNYYHLGRNNFMKFIKVKTLFDFVGSLKRIKLNSVSRVKNTVTAYIRECDEMFIVQTLECTWENKNDIIHNYKVAGIIMAQLELEENIYIRNYFSN